MATATLTDYPSCPAKLSDDLIEQYERDGYIAFQDVLSPEEVARARAELSRLVRTVTPEPDPSVAGSSSLVWRSATNCRVQFEKGHEPTGLDDPELDLKVRKFYTFLDSSEFLHYLAHEHPRIQGVLEGLIGPNPIQFQNMALVKPPFQGTEKPWHQDDAYFRVTPLEAICGCWIALDDAAPENGCMHVLPGWHKKGPLLHYHGRDCEIVEDRLQTEEVVPVPLRAGGAMFFSGVLPHQTPANQSPHRRRAIQYHYRAADSVMATREEYDRVFAEADGTPASCAAATARML